MLKIKKKKVKVFIQGRYLPEHNGAAVAFHETAKFLSKQYDIEVFRICSSINYKEKFIIDNIKVSSYPIPNILFKFKILNFLYFVCSFLYKLIFKKINGDIFHCVTISWHTLIVIYLTRIFCKKKKVLIDHTLNTDLHSYSNFKSRYLIKIKRFILYKAHIIRTLSPLLSNQLDKLGLKNHQLYLPNINLNRFKTVNKKKKNYLRLKLNINRSKFVILSVGRISFRKGSDIIIKAFEKINIKKQFLLILLGPCDEEFKKHKSKEGIFISDKKIENINEYMQSSDLFAMISRNEGLGIVFLEALASGLNLVIPRIKGLSDYILDNNNIIGRETSYNINDVIKKIDFFYKKKNKDTRLECRNRFLQIINKKEIISQLKKNWN